MYCLIWVFRPHYIWRKEVAKRQTFKYLSRPQFIVPSHPPYSALCNRCVRRPRAFPESKFHHGLWKKKHQRVKIYSSSRRGAGTWSDKKLSGSGVTCVAFIWRNVATKRTAGGLPTKLDLEWECWMWAKCTTAAVYDTSKLTCSKTSCISFIFLSFPDVLFHFQVSFLHYI